MLQADASKVSQRAKKRGLPQLGTLGAGNHYCEIQVVEEIYDELAAEKMGITRVGQVCVMIHSGSRGLGHQVATDALVSMERAMKRDGIEVNDRQVGDCSSDTFACSGLHLRMLTPPPSHIHNHSHSWPAREFSPRRGRTTSSPWLLPQTTPGSTAPA